MKQKAFGVIQSYYKHSPVYGGVFYACFFSMHTRIDIVLCGQQSEEEFLLVVDAIYDRLCQIEKLGNCYDADSELAQLNQFAAIRPQPVSHELYNMLAFCVDCNARTNGHFDITVHSADYISDLISKVQLSPKERTLFFQHPGININLSGFLKGYALESIRDLLRSYEVKDALVNMGNSSVLALGKHPLIDGWRVGFGQNVVSQNQEQEILLKDECLTISGNNSFERKHIIIPNSGKLVEGKWAVAVVTKSGAVGEVLSIALFAADARQWKSIKEEFSPRLVLKLV